MSEKNQTENLEKKVVVNEVETTGLVEVETNKEEKKAKAVKVAKKVGKIAAIAGVGLLGFLLGRKTSGGYTVNETEVIDVTDSDEE